MAFQIEELQTELRDKPEQNFDEKQSLDQLSTAVAQLVSLQSQLQESRDICDSKQLEITTLLSRLDFESAELKEHKTRVNKLLESLERVQSEL